LLAARVEVGLTGIWHTRVTAFGRHSGLRVSEYVLGTANFGSAPAAAGLEEPRAISEEVVTVGGITVDVLGAQGQLSARAMADGTVGEGSAQRTAVRLPTAPWRPTWAPAPSGSHCASTLHACPHLADPHREARTQPT
jgi:hypothetical protein